jgi:transposase
VDAAVLAAFAQAIRPQARPLKEAGPRALGELSDRRRSLIGRRVQERLRLNRATTRPLQKRLKKHLAGLDSRLTKPIGTSRNACVNRTGGGPRRIA